MSKKAIAAPTTYYVYTYAFPDGTVFYVGKGCNARILEYAFYNIRALVH